MGDSPLDAKRARVWAAAGILSGEKNVDWSPQTFPGQPAEAHASRILWQRVLLPGLSRDASTLRFRSVDQLFEIYLNGKVIYRMGNPDHPERYITAGTTLHLVDLGTVGEKHPLYFRVYSRSRNRGINGRVYLGRRADLIGGIIREESHRVVLSTIFILIGLILLAAYFSRRIDPAYPYFALFVISIGVWTVSQTEIKQLFLDVPILWRYVDLMALFSIPVGMLGFYEKVFPVRSIGPVRRARRLHVVFVFVAPALLAARIAPVATLLPPFQAILAVELLVLIAYSFAAAYRGEKHARIFFAGLFVTVLLGLHDLFVALTWIPWSRPISFWSVFLLLMVCGIILGHRYFDMQSLLENAGEAGDPRAEASEAEVASKQEDLDIAPILKTRFNLTTQEARICRELRAGTSRDLVVEKLGIKASTLKIHLKSIYGKTIEKGVQANSRSRDKLQRLTVFLHDLDS